MHSFSLQKSKYNDGNLVIHLIQSFYPAEVTYEEAHQNKLQFADKLLEGKDNPQMPQNYIENLRNEIIERNRMFVYRIEYDITPDIEAGIEYALSLLTHDQRNIITSIYSGNTNSAIAKKFKISVPSVLNQKKEALTILQQHRYYILYGKQGAEQQNESDKKRQQEWLKANTKVDIEKYSSPEEIYFKDLDSKAISVRLFNCMLRSNIVNFDMAAKCNIDKVRNLGKASKWELYCLLTEYGVTPEWTAQPIKKNETSGEIEQVSVPDEIVQYGNNYIKLEKEAMLLRKKVMDWKKDNLKNGQNCDWYKNWRKECEKQGVR